MIFLSCGQAPALEHFVSPSVSWLYDWAVKWSWSTSCTVWDPLLVEEKPGKLPRSFCWHCDRWNSSSRCIFQMHVLFCHLSSEIWFMQWSGKWAPCMMHLEWQFHFLTYSYFILHLFLNVVICRFVFFILLFHCRVHWILIFRHNWFYLLIGYCWWWSGCFSNGLLLISLIYSLVVLGHSCLLVSLIYSLDVVGQSFL